MFINAHMHGLNLFLLLCFAAQASMAQVWTNLAGGMDERVYALVFDTNGHLYAGGDFTNAGGVSVNHIACWETQNYIASVFGDYDANGKTDLAVYRNGYWSIFSLANGLIINDAGEWGGAGWEPVQ